ncbi:MAG: LarC family nickel insertion protein [Acidimicrobiia bacterium]|nr:LarC family nickel insertion protein [Acidimicrobiia bacterium]MDX2466531.1 LarC family nickel insertion protein [Acidimicrobiia bacterium]
MTISSQEHSHVHLDVVGGMAGDMFIAALLDARPDLVGHTVEAIRASGLPASWIVEPVVVSDGGLTGTRMRIEPPSPADTAGHHRFPELLEALRNAPLEESVRSRAVAILQLIADAEAEVHGVAVGDVVLHEVGAMDSIADVVGAACLIEALAPASWSVGPLPVGGGLIQTDHGALPVPAPATQRLLRGFRFVDDGVSGERITPTGAAILPHLDPTSGLAAGAFRSTETGHGFGTRSLPGIPNLLRSRHYVLDTGVSNDEQVVVVEFMVDDQTPEDLAIALDNIRDCPDVLEAVQTPAYGKKGRLGHAIQVLATAAALDPVAQACFEQTTTIGLRYRVESRKVLSRREGPSGEGVSVKVVERPGGPTAKADISDVGLHAPGHQQRQQLRRDVESTALAEGDDE